MNRIRELREALGWSIVELARRVGTSHQQISKLELEQRELTVAWMQKLSEALGCAPADLIAMATLASGDDVEPFQMATPSVGAAMARKGLHAYRVIGTSVTDAGVAPGDVITVDESRAAIDVAESGSLVLVEIPSTGQLVLRQFLRPSMLVTNRPGSNLIVRLDDSTIAPNIKGVLISTA